MPPETRELLLPSLLLMKNRRSFTFLPSFPLPTNVDFVCIFPKEALKILTKTEGRALFLLPSYRNMKETYQLLKGRLPYPLLVQCQKTKRILLAEFKEKSIPFFSPPVFFLAGNRCPGEALSCPAQ